MTEAQEDAAPERRGDRRAGDRRAGDRRRGDRRTPVPLWRSPWAFVLYGVAGALLLVLLFQGDDEGARQVGVVETAPVPPAVSPVPPPAASAPVEDAYGLGGFERLVTRGEAAVGQRVRTILYCGSIRSVGLRDVDQVEQAAAALADEQGRVPAAECRWGGGEQTNSGEMLLLVPPGLAEEFAAAPVTEQGFVPRRRVEGEVEWLGRSEALALRTAGVLRALQ